MRLFGKRKVSLNAAPPLLQTPRLVLRGFDPSDAVDVLARARGEAAGAMAECADRPGKFAPRPVARQGVSILEQVAVVHRAGVVAHTGRLLIGVAFGGALW